MRLGNKFLTSPLFLMQAGPTDRMHPVEDMMSQNGKRPSDQEVIAALVEYVRVHKPKTVASLTLGVAAAEGVSTAHAKAAFWYAVDSGKITISNARQPRAA